MRGGRGTIACLLGDVHRGVSRGGGTNGSYLKGSSPVEQEFLFENFVVGVLPHPLADSGGGVVYPDPSTSRVVGAAEEGIGEGGVAPVNPSDGEDVLFSHKFVCSLLTLAGKVALGELVAVKVLVHTAIRSVEDGEREAR